MLPLFDLLNHSYNTDIDWTGTKNGVSFHCGVGSKGVAAGCEVFNNYGNKGNEELMMSHGFAIYNNQHDSYGLKLSVCLPSDLENISGGGGGGGSSSSSSGSSSSSSSTSTGQVVCLGVFRLHRKDAEEQIPTALWRAVNDPIQYMKDQKEQQTMVNGSSMGVDGVASEPAPVHVEWEDVDMLLRTVRKQAQPFLLTKNVDTANAANNNSNGSGVLQFGTRAHFISMYRDGQRRVLEDAIVVLTEMLGGVEEAEEEEEEVGKEVVGTGYMSA